MRRYAFTLIELLVVISIISLIMAILLPSLAKARESARSVQCLTNLRSFGQALEMYAGNSRDHFPPGREPHTLGGRGGTETYDPPVYPTYADYTSRPLNDYLSGAEGEASKCPTDEEVWRRAGSSYAGNYGWINASFDTSSHAGGNMLPADPDGTASDDGPSWRGSVARGDIKGGDSRFVVLMESGLYQAMYHSNPAGSLAMFGPDTLNDFARLFWHSPERKWNAVYADGHGGVLAIAKYARAAQADGDPKVRSGDGWAFDWSE